jgi:aspartate racemase
MIKLYDNNIIGILGGMGPYAALEFCKQILDATPAKKDWEHIHTILDNNTKIPSRTRHILYGEEDPTPYIIKSINKLAKAGAKRVFLPCNSVHYFYDKVVPHIDIPWVNLIEVVADKIKKSTAKRTIVLGAYTTVTKKTYDSYLENLIYLDEKGNQLVFKIIEAVKINNISLAQEKTKKLLHYFNKYTFDSVILACTELTLIDLLVNNKNFTSFDSNNLYVHYLVKSTLNKE